MHIDNTTKSEYQRLLTINNKNALIDSMQEIIDEYHIASPIALCTSYAKLALLCVTRGIYYDLNFSGNGNGTDSFNLQTRIFGEEPEETQVKHVSPEDYEKGWKEYEHMLLDEGIGFLNDYRAAIKERFSENDHPNRFIRVLEASRLLRYLSGVEMGDYDFLINGSVNGDDLTDTDINHRRMKRNLVVKDVTNRLLDEFDS